MRVPLVIRPEPGQTAGASETVRFELDLLPTILALPVRTGADTLAGPTWVDGAEAHRG